jgi:regulator of RNase E activity RraB
MVHDFPNDADGDALRRLVADGSDLTKPMLINFQIAAANDVAARSLADAASKLGYATEIYDSPECSLPWTCECSEKMIAPYEHIIAAQKELAILARRFGGHPDGWGSFGNKPDKQPPKQ